MTFSIPWPYLPFTPLLITSNTCTSTFAVTMKDNPNQTASEKVLEATHFEDCEKSVVPATEARIDYSGAYEKTDPKEIALVKKLDRWIMPMLWSMYWLNYLDR